MNPAGFLFDLNFLHVAEEIIEQRQIRLEHVHLRDVSNPFEIPETYFKKIYRLPKGLVLHTLLPQLEPHVYQGQRSTYIPVHLRVLTTLHFLAQGTYQTGVGKDFHLAISQPVVSRIIDEITTIFTNQLFPRFVKFPITDDEINEVKRGFMDKFNFPNVIGAIDCSHVAIISPPVDDPIQPAIAYLNRKGYYSVNVQAICDSNLKFLAVNARFPGATHDAAIWSVSSIKRHLQRKYHQRMLSSYLLGDSGYPLQPWLMTPMPDAPENTPDGRYTHRHCSARNVIERAFGVWKQRFRCLLKHRVLHYSHKVAGQIIYSCAVLHNLCLMNNIVDNDDNYLENDEDNLDNDENLVNNDNEQVADEEIDADWLAAGRQIRNNIIQRFELE